METLRIGYLKYDTRLVPEQKSGGTYIKSDEPIEIEVDTSWDKDLYYTIASGEHFIPNYFLEKCNIKILNEKGVYVTRDETESTFGIADKYKCILETIKYYRPGWRERDQYYFSTDFLSSYSCLEGGLLHYIIRTFQKDFPWIDYYDYYQFKNKNDYVYTLKIKHEDMYKMREDKEVTVFLEYWEKNTYGSDYITVKCNEKKFNQLQKVLKRKYKYHLEKPEPNTLKKLKSYENISTQIAEHYKKLNQFLDENPAFTFVTLEEIPFTREVYEKLGESDVPLSKLVPIKQ